MRKFAKSTVVFLVLCASVLFLTVPAEASGEAAGPVKMLYVKGIPKIMKAGANQWTDCIKGMEIANGDRIRTSTEEVVELSFNADNSNIVSIKPNSDLFVRRGTAPHLVELVSGEAMALIKSLPANSTFEVLTPAGLSGARGTGWNNETTGDRSTFSAFENSIYAKGIDPSGNPTAGSLEIDTGLKTTVDRFEAPEKLESISERERERWNDWKEGLTERLRDVEAPKDTGAPAGMQGSPSGEAAGATVEDLENKESDMNKAERMTDMTTGADRTIDRIENITETRTQNEAVQEEENRLERQGNARTDNDNTPPSVVP